MKRGDQIIYVPDHAVFSGTNELEAGFVTSVKGDVVFCRYWNKFDPNVLRTTANSEGTNIRDLMKKDSVPQDRVEQALKDYCNEPPT